MSTEKKEAGTFRMKKSATDANIRPSISVRLIRHAESRNNEVYRNARYIYRGGTPDFDEAGWWSYVNTHRSSDPGLSEIGYQQAQCLADFLVPHLANQASQPVRVICSPMRRTLETIRPTLHGLEQKGMCQVLVHGFYFESEGCHIKDKPQEGMNQTQIRHVLNDESTITTTPLSDVQFIGFPHDENRGWYADGKGAETRTESENRAAKFYLWLCEYLDQELQSQEPDVFDAGVAVPGEEHEDEHDYHAPRQRRRRTALLVGHGDFMSLVLKRIIAGFGHYVESEGIPHRSAFVHYNTGCTELEYFGRGRFLLMSHNQTPHFQTDQYATLRSGGSLKDGWSYLMPNDEFILDQEVSVAFSDELEEHVREQTEALKALYLSSQETEKLHSDSNLSVEQDDEGEPQKIKHFVVKHGLQVVGVATYSEDTGRLTDVAVRPSAGKEVSETLFNAVKQHSRKLGRSGSLLITPRSDNSRSLFKSMGFEEIKESDEEEIEMELKH